MKKPTKKASSKKQRKPFSYTTINGVRTPMYLPAKAAETSSSTRFVRVRLSYVLDMGREYFERGLPHEVVGLKDDVGGLILRGLVHASTPFRVRYELGVIKLVPESVVLKLNTMRGKSKARKAKR